MKTMKKINNIIKLKKLIETAGKHGGFWISASGGTIAYLAGIWEVELKENFDTSMNEVKKLLTLIWGEDFYSNLHYIGGGWDATPDNTRFDVGDIFRFWIRKFATQRGGSIYWVV